MNRKSVIHYYIAVCVLCVIALNQGIHAQELKELQEDPIAFIGHGAMFDKSGRVIEPTLEFIRSAQSFYIKDIKRKLSTQKRARASTIAKTLTDGSPRRLKPDVRDVVSNSLLMDWLSNNNDEQLSHRRQGKMIMLNSKIIDLSPDIKFDQKLIDEFSVPRSLKRELNRSLLRKKPRDPLSMSWFVQSAHAIATTASGQAYIDECRAAGVPIPPDWGSNSWVERGTLKNEFISKPQRAQVHTFRSTNPEGTCIALPRRGTFGTIKLLGIICLGVESSNACFWDNQENGRTFEIGKNEDVPLSDFAGGAELVGGQGGACTSCHAGENPFVIHPDTVLGLPQLSDVALFSNEYYRPIVGSQWYQNEQILPSTGECAACHGSTSRGVAGRFPSFTDAEKVDYCGAIVRNAIDMTMPPANPGEGSRVAEVIDMCFETLNASCSINEECATGKCQGGQCVCGGDNDCAAGQYCNKRPLAPNRCLADATLDIGQACTKNAECSTNKCQGSGNARQCVCADDGDCDAGEFCNNRLGQNRCLVDGSLNLGQACFKNAECSSGKCQGDMCVCADDGDCSAGQFCNNRPLAPNRCLADASLSVGQSCNKNAECSSNKCQGSGGDRQCVCADDGDCGAGQFCNNRLGQNRCLVDGSLDVGDSCIKNAECDSNKCQGGMCVCANDSDCGTGQFCNNRLGQNRCLVDGSLDVGDSCVKNAECDSNKCQGGMCVCANDSDCGTGQFCNNRLGQNRCLVDGTKDVGQSCVKKQECESNKCSGGQCVCKEDRHCPGNQQCKKPLFGTNRCE